MCVCVCVLVIYIQFNEECSCAVVFPGMCHGKVTKSFEKMSLPNWKP